MTVSSESSRIEYTGDGSQTEFAVPFRFLEDDHLVVNVIDSDGSPTQQTLNSDFTVSGAGDASGGSVTFTSAPASGKTVRIDRWVPATQETDYVENDPFSAETHERALDKLTMLYQQLAERTGGAAQSVASGDFLGRSDENANRWDAEGDRITNVAEPIADADAATKSYVDTLSASDAAALRSVDGVRNDGGDVDFVSSGNMTIIPDDGNNRIVFEVGSTSGNVQSIDDVTPDSAGNVDLVAGNGMTIEPDGSNGIKLSASDNIGNATALQGRDVEDTDPAGGNWLGWDSGTLKWTPLGQYAVLRDEKSQGVHGGTFSSGSWETRDLNTKHLDADSVVTSLSSDRFKLSAGTYRVRIVAPALEVGRHRVRLRNVTDGTTELTGISSFARTNSSLDRAEAVGRITTDGTKEFEVQHRCASTRSVIGFGASAGFGGSEVYTVVELVKEQ